MGNARGNVCHSVRLALASLCLSCRPVALGVWRGLSWLGCGLAIHDSLGMNGTYSHRGLACQLLFASWGRVDNTSRVPCVCPVAVLVGLASLARVHGVLRVCAWHVPQPSYRRVGVDVGRRFSYTGVKQEQQNAGKTPKTPKTLKCVNPWLIAPKCP